MKLGTKVAALAMVGAVAFLIVLGGPGAQRADADVTNVRVVRGWGPTQAVAIIEVTAEDGDGDVTIRVNPNFEIVTADVLPLGAPLDGAVAPRCGLGAAPPDCTAASITPTLTDNNGDGFTDEITVSDADDDVSRILVDVVPPRAGHPIGACTGIVGFECPGPQFVVPGEVEIRATQDGVTESATLGVPGQPKLLTLEADPLTVQAGGGDLGESDLTARVTDGLVSGFPAENIRVDWDTDEGVLDTTASLTNEDAEALNMLTSDEDTGIAEVTATVCADDPTTAADIAPCDGVPGGFGTTNSLSESVEVEIIGGPHDVAISVEPSELSCTPATEVNVTADVTNEDGDPVVDDNRVEFRATPSTQTLLSPRAAATADGTADSVLSFVTGTFVGTTAVIVEAEITRADGTVAVDTATVTCIQPEPTVPPPAPTATPGVPTITPPPTGSGGYLPQDGSGGLSWLALTGMSLGGLLVSLGGLAARRLVRR